MGGTIDPEEFWKPSPLRVVKPMMSIAVGALDMFLRDSIKAQMDHAVASATSAIVRHSHNAPPHAPSGSKMSGWGVPIEGEAFKGFAAWLPNPTSKSDSLLRVSREPIRPRTLLAFSGKINLRLGLRGK